LARKLKTVLDLVVVVTFFDIRESGENVQSWQTINVWNWFKMLWTNIILLIRLRNIKVNTISF
jgi:hypothetical protein